MKNKVIKKLAVISSGLMLCGCLTASAPTTVKATNWYVKHEPYFLTHKVKLTKRVAFKKFKFGKHTYQDHPVATKYLKKETVIRLRKGGASYYWFATGHGMKYTKYYCWTTFQRGKWFKVIK